jgi:hypothetical protein
MVSLENLFKTPTILDAELVSVRRSGAILACQPELLAKIPSIASVDMVEAGIERILDRRLDRSRSGCNWEMLNARFSDVAVYGGFFRPGVSLRQGLPEAEVARCKWIGLPQPLSFSRSSCWAI